jgi:gamma-glutamyltranspeptidase / glutathione hydrolase / leukotriene-C4 hydrolase
MAAKGGGLHGPLLPVGDYAPPVDGLPRGRRHGRPWTALAIAAALLALAGALLLLTSVGEGDARRGATRGSPHEAESETGAAAADDARCSEVGAAALRAGGHAVDAAVAAALCLGVVHPMSSAHRRQGRQLRPGRRLRRQGDRAGRGLAGTYAVACAGRPVSTK